MISGHYNYHLLSTYYLPNIAVGVIANVLSAWSSCYLLKVTFTAILHVKKPILRFNNLLKIKLTTQTWICLTTIFSYTKATWYWGRGPVANLNGWVEFRCVQQDDGLRERILKSKVWRGTNSHPTVELQNITEYTKSLDKLL